MCNLFGGIYSVTIRTGLILGENVKKLTVMGTKCAPKKVEVNRVYFRIFEMSK